MADQRQGFRFRLPWQSAAPTPAPTPRRQPPPPQQQQPPRVSAPETQKPTNPAQKPPSKPPGTSQSQVSEKTDPKPSSPSNGSNTRPQASSKPASPSRATAQSRAASVPPSPSRAGPQRPSPSRASRTATKPPSPSRVTPPSPQPMPKSGASSEAQNPEVAAEASSSPSSSLAAMEKQSAGAGPSEGLQVKTQDESPLPQEEQPPQPARSVSPKPQRLKADITSENVMHTTKNQSPDKMTIQPKEISPQSLKEPSVSLAVPNQISKEAAERSDSPLSESDANSDETVAERKEIVQELTKVEASSSRAHTKTRPNVAAYEEEQKEAHGGEEVLLKEALDMPRKHTKPRDKSKVNESHNNHPKSTGEHGPFHKEIVGDISKFVHKVANTQHPKLGAEDKPVTVITLAGDNKGASMHLGSDASKREGKIHIRRGYKKNPDESHDATTDGEGSSHRPSSEHEDEQVLETYVNSNVQSVNNSIVFDSSITETNPGVKVVVVSPEMKEPVTKPTKKSDSHETKKAEVNVTPAEKHTYQPIVRRRCLKGLMMESSDSDPDKPRRHGCRVACKEKGKSSEIDVL